MLQSLVFSLQMEAFISNIRSSSVSSIKLAASMLKKLTSSKCLRIWGGGGRREGVVQAGRSKKRQN